MQNFNPQMGVTPGQGVTLNINPLDYSSIKCECGNDTFIPAMIFREIDGALVGQAGEKVPLPQKVFICAKCGELSPMDKQQMEKAQKAKEQIKKSNLII